MTIQDAPYFPYFALSGNTIMAGMTGVPLQPLPLQDVVAIYSELLRRYEGLHRASKGDELKGDAMSFPRERLVSEGRIPEKYLIRARCPICRTEFRASVFEALTQFDRARDDVRLGVRCPTCAFHWWTKLYVPRSLITDKPFDLGYEAKADWDQEKPE